MDVQPTLHLCAQILIGNLVLHYPTPVFHNSIVNHVLLLKDPQQDNYKPTYSMIAIHQIHPTRVQMEAA